MFFNRSKALTAYLTGRQSLELGEKAFDTVDW